MLGEEGIGCIVFTPFAQGLDDKYLKGIPKGSRASRPGSLSRDQLKQAANLDEGDIWPTAFALNSPIAAAEKKIRKLVKRAAS